MVYYSIKKYLSYFGMMIRRQKKKKAPLQLGVVENLTRCYGKHIYVDYCLPLFALKCLKLKQYRKVTKIFILPHPRIIRDI